MMRLLIFIAWASLVASQAGAATGGLIVSVSGEVTMSDGSGGSTIVNVGSPFEAGQKLETGANGEVSVALHQGLAVTLKSDTKTRLVSWQAPPRIPRTVSGKRSWN
jgi:hypothetical protein